MKKIARKQHVIHFLLIASVLLLVAFISNFTFFRWDLSDDHKYSLTPTTKQLLQKIEDKLEVKIYLDGDMPASYRKLKSEIKYVLDECKAYSNNIEYVFINPQESSSQAERDSLAAELYRKGLVYSQITEKEKDAASMQVLWPGAIVNYKGREMSLNFLENSQSYLPREVRIANSITNLEYSLANVIHQLNQVVKPKIGFIQGHGELNPASTFGIYKALEEFYSIEYITIANKLDALLGCKAIIIADPSTAFDEKDKFIIDQFIMKGGRSLWLVESTSAKMDSLNRHEEFLATPMELNLTDQLFKYGVRISPNLVMDYQSAAVPIIDGIEGNQPVYTNYNFAFLPLLDTAQKHPITDNIGLVRAEFASNLETVGAKDITKTILLKSSKLSKIMPNPTRVSINIVREKLPASYFNSGSQNIAALLEGNFTSIFQHRVPALIAEDKEIRFVDKCAKPNKMIVISDGDIIKNEVGKNGNPIADLGDDRFLGRGLYGNKDFVVNAINYLCDDSGLLLARSKNIPMRLLDKSKVESSSFTYQLVNVLAPLSIILLIAIALISWRRFHYAK